MVARNLAMSAGPLLSARERQCLELAAYGKSDWTISQLLKISEHTVHKHIEAAKRRLGVATRVQAIIWAAQRREITVGDVVRAEQPPKREPGRSVRKTPFRPVRKLNLPRRRDAQSAKPAGRTSQLA